MKRYLAHVSISHFILFIGQYLSTQIVIIRQGNSHFRILPDRTNVCGLALTFYGLSNIQSRNFSVVVHFENCETQTVLQPMLSDRLRIQ